MNNEPVAWMVQYKGKHDFTFYKPISHDDSVVIPLYTYPAKTLTDEEIIEIAKQYFNENLHHGLHFARAILRKAQNK